MVFCESDWKAILKKHMPDDLSTVKLKSLAHSLIHGYNLMIIFSKVDNTAFKFSGVMSYILNKLKFEAFYSHLKSGFAKLLMQNLALIHTPFKLMVEMQHCSFSHLLYTLNMCV